jgi:hypothetical protein
MAEIFYKCESLARVEILGYGLCLTLLILSYFFSRSLYMNAASCKIGALE